jgi:hypothetical protein
MAATYERGVQKYFVDKTESNITSECAWICVYVCMYVCTRVLRVRIDDRVEHIVGLDADLDKAFRRNPFKVLKLTFPFLWPLLAGTF